MTVVDTALLPAMLEAARALRQQFAACCAEFAEKDASPDAVASAMVRHLSKITVASLPQAAQLIWRERVVRPLRADAEKPLAQRAISSIRSWPSQRVADLQAALVEIESILETHENELAHEVIYTEISRTYS
jgi:hypothetical protein